MKGFTILLLSLVALLGLPSLLEAGVCMPRDETHIRTLQDTADDEHVTGRLFAKASTNYRCECLDTCRSNCTPAWKTRNCDDTGLVFDLPYVHKEYQKSLLKSGSKSNAIGLNASGADCGSGFGCFAKKCVSGTCGGLSGTFSVEPVGLGFSVTYNPSIPVIHDIQLDQPFECDRCVTSAELALDFPAIVDIIRTPQENMTGWLEICTFTCTGTNCGGTTSCSEVCGYNCVIY